MPKGPKGPSEPSGKNRAMTVSGWAGFLIGPLFLLLAGWFLWGPDLSDAPVVEGARVTADDIDIAPRRKTLGNPALININGFDRTCMDCHRMFASGQKSDPRQRLQHQHIALSHGPNVRCATCHDEQDRDRLVLQDGSTVELHEISRLCGDCHRRVLDDWKAGMHGRTNGFWDPRQGELRRLDCAECHDPHNPTFPARGRIRPLPGPNTLRMGAPALHSEAHEPTEEDPLRAHLGGSATMESKGGQ